MPVVLGAPPTAREILDVQIGMLIDGKVEITELKEELFEGFEHFEPFEFKRLKNKQIGLFQTPLIPDSVYRNLPEILKRGALVFNKRERDIWLTAALAVLSGIFSNVFGQYRYEEVYPNLFNFTITSQGNGKAVMKFAKKLANEIHEEKESEYNKELQKYFIEKKKNKHVQKPVAKLLFFPGDVGSTQLVKLLKANDGIGIICESEADTLSVALEKEWGNFSDKLRNAFDNTEISLSRSTNQENISVKNTKLSMAITGTPDQLPKMIGSSQNGLLSRNIFYIFQSDDPFDTVAPKSKGGIAAHFNALSKEIYQLYQALKGKALLFRLSDKQIEAVDQFFKDADEFVCENIDHSFKGFIRRQALISFKIAMLLSILRNGNEANLILDCTDTDVNSALRLAKVFIVHTVAVLFQVTGVSKSKINITQQRAFDLFPVDKEVTRAEAIQLCQGLGKSDRIIDQALNVLVAKNLIQKLDQGKYIRKK